MTIVEARDSSLRGWTIDRVWIIGVLILAALPRSLHAQSDGGWVSKRVIIRFGTVLRDDQGRVENDKLKNRARGVWKRDDLIFRVEQVNGTRLFINSEFDTARGWVQMAEVILYDQAIDYFTDEIRANPANVVAYYGRGIAWRAREKYQQAIADFTEAIRLDPRHAGAYYMRGLARYDKDEREQAIADFTEAIRLEPRHASAYYLRSTIWLYKKEYGKEIADLSEVIRIDPGDWLSYSFRGVAWTVTKEYDKAIADFTELMRLEPKHGDGLYRIAVLQLILHRDNPVDQFQKVLDLEGWKGRQALRAVILGSFAARQAGDKTRAKTFLDDATIKCERSGWPYPIVKFLRGELDEAGLLALAANDYQRADAHCYLGLDYTIKGRKDAALAHYRWVRDHGTIGSNMYTTVYTIAVAELDRLEGKLKPADDSPAPK
jgi:lipoprotein NlpI